MAAINRDPEVTRYLNRPVGEASVAAFYGQVQAHWERFGFGPYAVEVRDRDPPAFAGFVGIAYPLFLPELAEHPELGWRLDRSTWGRGYATEGAIAARDDAFARLGLPELIAIIHPENVRSQRVATKLGMSVWRTVHNPVLRRTVEVWRVEAP